MKYFLHLENNWNIRSIEIEPGKFLGQSGIFGSSNLGVNLSLVPGAWTIFYNSDWPLQLKLQILLENQLKRKHETCEKFGVSTTRQLQRREKCFVRTALVNNIIVTWDVFGMVNLVPIPTAANFLYSILCSKWWDLIYIVHEDIWILDKFIILLSSSITCNKGFPLEIVVSF